jgi:hypothetical protein
MSEIPAAIPAPGMETINGFTIIGEYYVTSQERVIIGYRETKHLDGNDRLICEFMTARTRPRSESPREWYSGNYFSGTFSTAENRQKAFADFVRRADWDGIYAAGHGRD